MSLTGEDYDSDTVSPGRDPDDERDDMLCEQDDERRRRLVNLDGLPQPDNQEVTAMLVGKLLDAVGVGDDVVILRMTERIREVGGRRYVVALTERVNAACAHRWSEAT